MSHTSSKTWVSPEAKEREIFNRMGENLDRVMPNSPFVPKTWAEWVRHRLEMQELGGEQIKHKIKLRQEAKKIEYKEKIKLAFGGKLSSDGKTAVISMPSIWTRDYGTPVYRGSLVAPWPSRKELEYEGESRGAKFGRFPPLPREPAPNETVPWEKLRKLRIMEFDQVWQVPRLDQGLAVAVEENRVRELLGESLLDEIDK
ncbi:MAG: hypothetical protein M1834_002878 [Cirrosporium novae-zelandiae]|nr:MAG: hypothetical protein M1834_002878 [Cirrosporium novae-zelandiae]